MVGGSGAAEAAELSGDVQIEPSISCGGHGAVRWVGGFRRESSRRRKAVVGVRGGGVPGGPLDSPRNFPPRLSSPAPLRHVALRFCQRLASTKTDARATVSKNRAPYRP